MKVMLALLTQSERHGWIHPLLADWLMDHQRHCIEAQVDTLLYERVHELRPQSVARTEVCRRFLDSDADALLMIDNDNPPAAMEEPKNPLLLSRLLALADVAVAPVPTYQYGNMPFTLYRQSGTDPDGRLKLRTLAGEEIAALDKLKPGTPRFLYVDAAGCGCMMIGRQVIERLHPWAFLPNPADPWHAQFRDERQNSGFPEDIFFTRQVRELLDGHIAADFDMVLSHYHTADMLEMMIRPQLVAAAGKGPLEAADGAGRPDLRPQK